MLDQFTITKAIHNTPEPMPIDLSDWNARSIYNYESHSQLCIDVDSIPNRLECSINLQLRKPFTTVPEIEAIFKWIGMLDQFTITKAIHNRQEVRVRPTGDWNARSIYNYESHSQL